ncbi:hypothetical protein L208DRAFT_1416800, partial [Tricholoma matsutake]
TVSKTWKNGHTEFFIDSRSSIGHWLMKTLQLLRSSTMPNILRHLPILFAML